MASTDGKIHGRIRNPSPPPIKTKKKGGSRPPAARFEVLVFHADGRFRTKALLNAYTWEYTARDLPTGNYRLVARDLKGVYLSTWYARTLQQEHGALVHVESGFPWGSDAVNVDFDMIPWSRIEGQVLSLDHKKLHGIEVTVYDFDTRAEVRGGEASHNYSVPVKPGRYAVRFHDPGGRFEDQWYSRSPTLESATPLEVGVDKNADQVNVFLAERQQPPGAVSGRIVGKDGRPAGRAEVIVHDEHGKQVVTKPADADGRFRIDGLLPAAYRLGVHSLDHAFMQIWFDGRQSVGAADLLTVRPGEETTGIDIAVTHVGGGLRGRVLAPDGAPTKAGVEVRVIPSDETRTTLAVTTASDGSYRFDHVPPGDYRVVFLPLSTEYAPQWFDAVAREADATSVTVSENTTAGGVDARLRHPGSSISGTVTAGDAGAITSHARVYVSRPDGYYVATVLVGSQGAYMVDDLEPGSYRLEVALGDPYLRVWYPGVPSEADARTVSVGRGQARTGVDLTVPLGAVIEGTVTTLDNQPLPPLTTARAWNGDVPSWDEDEVAGDGRYRLDGLAPGSYTVVVADPTGRYVRTWYPSATDEESATPVVVGAGETRSGIDVTVAPSAVALTGTVSTSSGEPVPAEVFAYLTSPGAAEDVISRAAVASDGSFILRGFPPGTYDLHVEDWSGEHDPVILRDLELSAGLADRNVVLPLRGSISGTVSTSDGNPVPTNVILEAYSASTGELARQGFATPGAGFYRIGGLVADDYKVFVRTLGEYAEQWYPGKASQDEAHAIGVADGTSVTGIDLVLHP